MTTEITKVNGSGLGGTFKPKNYSTTYQEAERQYQECFIENRIDFLGWF